MKRNVLIVFLLFCNVYVLWKYELLKATADDIAEKYSVLSIREERVSSKLKKYNNYQQWLNGCVIPSIEVLDSKGDSITFASIDEEQKGCLFFRFKETHCDACVMGILQLLKQTVLTNERKIVVLCGYSNAMQFFAFGKNRKNILVYNIEELPWELDYMDESYFFTISDGKICDVFVPLKDDFVYLQDYIECMSQKLSRR